MYQLKIVANSKIWKITLQVCVLLTTTGLASENGQTVSVESWLKLVSQGRNERTTQIEGEADLLTIALSNNSELKSQYAEWHSRMAEVNTIVSLPDPSLSFGYFIEPIETAQGPQKAKFSIGQTIPWISKTRASKASKKSKADQSFQILNNSRLKLKRDVALLWSEAAFINEAFSILDQKTALSKDLEEILNIQYQSASISHKNMIDAQVQTLMLMDQLEDLKDRRYRLNVKLAGLLELDAPLPGIMLASATFNAFTSFENFGVEEAHPRLMQLADLQQETRALKRLAESEYIPDFRLGMDYIITGKRSLNGVEVTESGRDPLVFSAGISLPLWNWKSKKAAVKAIEWREKRVAALIESELRMLQQEYDLSRSKLDEDLRQIELYRELLIPKALEIEKVLEQAYISQSADIATLTMARQKRLDQHFSLLEAQHSAAIQVAILTYLEGEKNEFNDK